MNKDDIIKELDEKTKEFRAELDDGLINYNQFMYKLSEQFRKADKQLKELERCLQ